MTNSLLWKVSIENEDKQRELQKFYNRNKTIFVKLNIKDIAQVADCYEHGVPWVLGGGGVQTYMMLKCVVGSVTL